MAAYTYKKPEEENSTALKTSAAYQPSDAVKQAQSALKQQLDSKPGAYQSQWQTQLNDTIDKIMNREKFSYDLNGDALYQQYKDQYTNAGKMAMMDTMGQAQAMTGGYGNSYAQMAGQQAYQGQLQNLNAVIPELYQMALDQYNQQGQDLYDRYSLLGAQEEQAYGRYRDSVSDWNTQADRLQNQYYAERDFDYGQFADDRAYDYQAGRDAVADQQWQQSFDYQQNRDQVADQQWQDSFQYQKDRDQVADSQWRESFDYQQNRDQVADSQWQQSFDYQQGRDQVADSQWNQSFQYQQDRDKVADSQWQAQFEEAMRQWNEDFAYQQSRDQVADSQWRESFDYQQGRDQVADQQWKDTFQYQQGRDQVADSQWQAQFNEAARQWNEELAYQQGRDQVADSQWQAQFDEAMRQWNEELAYQQNRDQVADQQWDKSFQYQQGRDQVADNQWQAEFDEAKRQYDQTYQQKYSSSGGSGSSGTSEETANTVIPDSVIKYCESNLGSDSNIERYLGVMLQNGSITEEQAFYMLGEYCSDEYLKANYPGLVDTTVSTSSGGSVPSATGASKKNFVMKAWS